MDTSSDESQTDNVIIKENRRKRGVTNDSVYKRNVIKHARVKGLPYKNWKGEDKPLIVQGEHCK